MNCLVIDDDKLSRTLISKMVSKIPNINLIAEFESAIVARNLIDEGNIDLIFLDIEMPEITGIDFAKTLDSDIKVIFISSKEEYAIQAFELNVVDYIVKPTTQERLELAVSRAQDFIVNTDVLNSNDTIFIKDKGAYFGISISDIYLVESLGDYIILYTPNKRYTINSSMKVAESKLPSDIFCRIHRSYIINTKMISSIQDDQVKLKYSESSYSISRSFKKDFFSKLKFL